MLHDAIIQVLTDMNYTIGRLAAHAGVDESMYSILLDLDKSLDNLKELSRNLALEKKEKEDDNSSYPSN